MNYPNSNLLNKIFDKLTPYIRKNKILFFILKPIFILIRTPFRFIMRNQSFLFLKKSNHTMKNIFIVDNRVHSMQFDIVVLLIRGSNFFYKDKWSLIVYQDPFYRYSSRKGNKEIYFNNLINIFFQTLILLPNKPKNIKFVEDIRELSSLINRSTKIFPEKYNYLSGFNKDSQIENFNENDLKNFKKNQPILEAPTYHLKIFQKYLEYWNIDKYCTITIRTKDWNNSQWNTDLNDIEIYLKFIKKNNILDNDFLIIPDTQKEVPKALIDLLIDNDLKFHIYHQGSFSIPMRFLAYSNSYFNFASTNGPPSSFLPFLKNNAYFILKDSVQGEDYVKFFNEYNNNIFLERKIIFFRKYSSKS